MEIKYSKLAVKTLKKLDIPIKKQILTAIEGLTKEPPEGEQSSFSILLVIKIGSRGDVYK